MSQRQHRRPVSPQRCHAIVAERRGVNDESLLALCRKMAGPYPHTDAQRRRSRRRRAYLRFFDTGFPIVPAPLPEQRRLVDVIVAYVADQRAAGVQYVSAETLQARLLQCDRVLYMLIVGDRPGDWTAFLRRHGDAWRTVQLGRCLYITLPPFAAA